MKPCSVRVVHTNPLPLYLTSTSYVHVKLGNQPPALRTVASYLLYLTFVGLVSMHWMHMFNPLKTSLMTTWTECC